MSIVTNPNQEGIEVQNRSTEVQNKRILYFSPIEDSIGDKLSSQFCKELWLASGCAHPFQPECVSGNLQYIKTTLKAIENNCRTEVTP